MNLYSDFMIKSILMMHRSSDTFHITGLTTLENPSFSNEKSIEWMMSGSRAEWRAVFGFALAFSRRWRQMGAPRRSTSYLLGFPIARFG